MTLRQLPGFAFRSPTDYANEMARMHDLYDASLGAGVVSALERLQLFHVFSSAWFSAGIVVLIISIVACTIDRTPRLWRAGADIRVVQPEPFFDPLLPDRAALDGVDAASVAATLRRHRFAVRRAEVDGVAYVYGDRNRWTKLATLVTHTGLVLFLVAAAVTSRLGDEQGLVVAEGDSLTVQPIGTPGLLLVRNLGFDAPGFLETGKASDFTTHLAVFKDGQQVAEKRVIEFRRIGDQWIAEARAEYLRPGHGARSENAAEDLLMSVRLVEPPDQKRAAVARERHAIHPVEVQAVPRACFAVVDESCRVPEAVARFRDVLMAAGLVTTVRRTRGDDIDAACGQLAGQVQDRTRRQEKRLAREARHLPQPPPILGAAMQLRHGVTTIAEQFTVTAEVVQGARAKKSA